MSDELRIARRLRGERASLLERIEEIDRALLDPLRWSILHDLAEAPKDVPWLAETSGATPEVTRVELRRLIREGIVVRVQRGLYGLSRQRGAR